MKDSRQFWRCETCGAGHFAGERGEVHVVIGGLFCRRCHPTLAGSGGETWPPDPLPTTGRMRKAEPSVRT